MDSYNITVRYIGLGAIGVAALALIVAAGGTWVVEVGRTARDSAGEAA